MKKRSRQCTLTERNARRLEGILRIRHLPKVALEPESRTESGCRQQGAGSVGFHVSRVKGQEICRRYLHNEGGTATESPFTHYLCEGFFKS